MPMLRREFIAGLGSAAAWPVMVRGQVEPVRRVGVLHSDPREDVGSIGRLRFEAFKRGLTELGWIEGRNIRFDQRWAENSEQLPVYAAEVVRLRPDAIFVNTSPSLRAVRRATSDIPIVFSAVTDPVGQGFVSSLARPGGNITGFAGPEFAIATKMLELLKRLVPTVDRIAVMFDPAQPASVASWAEIEVAAPSLALQLSKAPVHAADEIERVIAAAAKERNGGLVVLSGPAIAFYRDLITALALRHRLPAVYGFRFYVDNGGLASYAPDDNDLSYRAAEYVDRILKGEKPRDLPVHLPTKYELILNLKTAKALGLVVPPGVLAIADEVIE
jgi:putative tryptophan/tyrosine transport system substrate-binding protein